MVNMRSMAPFTWLWNTVKQLKTLILCDEASRECCVIWAMFNTSIALLVVYCALTYNTWYWELTIQYRIISICFWITIWIWCWIPHSSRFSEIQRQYLRFERNELFNECEQRWFFFIFCSINYGLWTIVCEPKPILNINRICCLLCPLSLFSGMNYHVVDSAKRNVCERWTVFA